MIQPDAREDWSSAKKECYLVAMVTAISFVARLVFVIGYGLGDDGTYLDAVERFLNEGFKIIGPTGQAEYRVAWYPVLALFLNVLGWNSTGFAFYSLLCGTILIPLTAFSLSYYVPARTRLPLLVAIILAFYPTLFVDSLLVVNDLPAAFWTLLAVVLLRPALQQVFSSDPAQPFRTALGFSFLGGTSFALAYGVKISSVPCFGFFLLGEVLAHVWIFRPRCRVGNLFINARRAILLGLSFSVSPFLLQLFFLTKTGSFFGNYYGEVSLYEDWIPSSYFRGEYDARQTLSLYPQVLFGLDGPVEFKAFLHGLWPWTLVVFGPLLLLVYAANVPRKGNLHSGADAMATDLRLGPLLCCMSIALLFGMLFMQFWPARLDPFYLPNTFTGRPWRYLDVLIPHIAVVGALIVGILCSWGRPWVYIATGCIAANLGVCGYSMVLRYHVLADRVNDFALLASEVKERNLSCRSTTNYTDPDGAYQVRFLLGWRGVSTTPLFPGRWDIKNGCLWTGGGRREGLTVDAALRCKALPQVEAELEAIATAPGLERPWRLDPGQIWRVGGSRTPRSVTPP